MMLKDLENEMTKLTLRLKRRRAGWGIRGKGRVRKERKGGQERGMTSGFAGW